MGAFAACPSLNMLNTRYIIYNPEQPPLRNPFAFGNAWFVDKVEVVENADAEIAALNTINPLTTAVVDKRFANEVKGFTPQSLKKHGQQIDSLQELQQNKPRSIIKVFARKPENNGCHA